MKRSIRFYNVLFPVWFFWLLPSVLWLVILAGNFAVDSLILAAAMKWHRVENKRTVWKKSILRIWLIGFFSDLLGAALIFGLTVLFDYIAPQVNTWLFPGVTLISVPGVLLAGFLIYVLNRRFSFRHSGLDPVTVERLCWALMLFTAPYAMLIPLYG